MTTQEKLKLIHCPDPRTGSVLNQYTDDDLASMIDLLLAAGWQHCDDGAWLDHVGGEPDRRVLKRMDKHKIGNEIVEVPVYQTEVAPLRCRHSFLSGVIIERRRAAAADPNWRPLGKDERIGTGKMLRDPVVKDVFNELVQTQHTPPPTIGLPPPSREPEQAELSKAELSERQKITEALTAAGWRHDPATGWWWDPEGEVDQKPRLVERKLANGQPVKQYQCPPAPAAYPLEQAYKIQRARDRGPTPPPKPVLRGTGRFLIGPDRKKFEVKHWHHPAPEAAAA